MPYLQTKVNIFQLLLALKNKTDFRDLRISVFHQKNLQPLYAEHLIFLTPYISHPTTITSWKNAHVYHISFSLFFSYVQNMITLWLGLKIQNTSWTPRDMDERVGLAASHGSGVAGACGKLGACRVMDGATLCQDKPIMICCLLERLVSISTLFFVTLSYKLKIFLEFFTIAKVQ